jgi:hypothetical protein
MSALRSRQDRNDGLIMGGGRTFLFYLPQSPQMLTGSVLFHLALSPVFQVKKALDTLGLFGALVVAQSSAAVIEAAPASMTLSMPLRAGLSLLICASVGKVSNRTQFPSAINRRL